MPLQLLQSFFQSWGHKNNMSPTLLEDMLSELLNSIKSLCSDCVDALHPSQHFFSQVRMFCVF